jgi:hypothetical protein
MVFEREVAGRARAMRAITPKVTAKSLPPAGPPETHADANDSNSSEVHRRES